MRTPAQRKASAAYDARRRERGDKLVRVWLDPIDYADFIDMADYFGSMEKAMSECISRADWVRRRPR